MDTIMYIVLIAVVIIVVAVFRNKRESKEQSSEKPKEKKSSSFMDEGEIGEWKISSLLSRLGGTLYNDYMLVDDKGMSHQIDHILVLNSGVFVIETKNYSGRIYGDNESREWTQVLGYGKEKHTFYNPIKQNATHLFALKEILPKGTVLHTCVVFVQDNIEYIKSDRVFKRKGLIEFIKSKPSSEKMENKIQKINEILQEKRNNDITKTQHIENINAMRKEVQENRKCPRCGGRLILRKSASGSFYGCENYPKCRFTKKA